jgi:uncharacterized tellurite resistance protein B-like protein
MTDEELAEALRGLGMDQSTWRALALLPLVQVAWADGHVQEAEQDMILELAATHYHLDDDGQLLLKNWLHHAPSPSYVRRGQQVLVALCQHEDEDFDRTHLDDVVRLSTEVAKAAGGFFGFGAIDRAEAEAVERIAEALDLTAAMGWIAPDDETYIPADADESNDGPDVTVTFHTEGQGGPSSPATLLHLGLDGQERSCPVATEGVRIGRNRDNDVQVHYDAQVSRNHCELIRRGDRFYVRDLESTRGTWVNGERVIERRLLGGESIEVGMATFYFVLGPNS